jgi:hypothetical protein
VYEESYFREGLPHGIERQWKSGILCKGYPRYFINGVRVTRGAYQKACAKDPDLPAHVARDDHPKRPPPMTQPVNTLPKTNPREHRVV